MFDKRDMKALRGALLRAIDWEKDLAEANNHIPVEKRKALRTVAKYERLLQKMRVVPIDR